MKRRLKILIIIMIIMLLLCGLLVITADGEEIATASLLPNTTSVEKGELFTITLYVDTAIPVRGFTLRQLFYDADKVELMATTYNGTVLEMATLKDLGDIQPGNLTYAMGGFLDVSEAFVGYNKIFIMTFKALAEGIATFTIPETIWSGQVGLVISDVDTTIWTNTDIEITDSTPSDPPNGGGGGGGPPYVPPDDPPYVPPDDPPTPNVPPVADGAGPYLSLVNESILFNGSGSYDSDGNITSYLWIFSDGTNSSDKMANHIYTLPGNYTVKLTVTDDDGNFSNYFTYAFISEPEEPDEPDEPDIPSETDDNKTKQPPEEFNPMIFIGIVLLIGFIILIIYSLVRRKND